MVEFLLPYLQVTKSCRLGNFGFEPFQPGNLDVVFHDNAGNPITRPTAVRPASRGSALSADPGKELDSILQFIAYAIFDEAVCEKWRELVSVMVAPQDHVLRYNLRYASGAELARRYVDPDSFVYRELLETGEPPAGEEFFPSRVEYAPPHVRILKLRVKKILRDPVFVALRRSTESIATAVRWFNRSRSASPLFTKSQRLLFRCIAFEALLELPRVEKTLTFAQSIRILLQVKEGERLARWATDFYDKRSDVVHAGREVSTRLMAGKHEFGSEFKVSEIVFVMCLRRLLGLHHILATASPEWERLEAMLDAWLIPNLQRLQEMANKLLDESLSDPAAADRFLRLAETVNLSDLEGLQDALVKRAMENLKNVTLSLVKRLEASSTDDARAKLHEVKEALEGLNLTYRPDPSDLPLSIPGYPVGWDAGDSDYTRIATHRLWRRGWQERETAWAPGHQDLKSETVKREPRFVLYAGQPVVSIRDLCSALQSLNELRKLLNPVDYG